MQVVLLKRDYLFLLSPGNSTTLFPSQALPVEKLLDRLFLIIQSEWIRAKQPAAAPAVAPAAPTVLDQIEQLNDLKNKGILTEEEFQNKKKELLAKL